MSSPDWEHLGTFVAVAAHGSLTAAAQQRGISQPTAGRHIQALEEALGVTLFVRHARGLTLTDQGAELFEESREVASRMEAIFRRARGEEAAELSGTVRVTAAEPIGAHALAPCFAQLRRDLPQVAIELVVDNSPANLSRREADIAARMFKPTQLDLVARRIGEVKIGMFASRSYVKRHGKPRGMDADSGHTWIGMDRDPSFHEFIRQLGISPRVFGFRCDSILAQIQAVKEGIGIGGLHLSLAARDPEDQ